MDHVSCEKCESKKTQTWSKGVMFFGLIATASIFFWVGIFLPFMWIVTVVFIALAPISLFLPKLIFCKDCNHLFTKKGKNKNVLAN